MYKKEFLKNTIRQFLEEYQNKTAFFIYREKGIYRISYKKFGKDILRAARTLVDNDIKKKHIALAIENCYEWYVVFFAILISGNTAVLLNQNLATEELVNQCRFADVEYIFGDSNLKEICDGERIIFLSWTKLYGERMLSYDEIFCPEKMDMLCLLFTSGTLGTTKGVMLSANNMRICMSSLMDKFHVHKTLLVLPLYHISGIGGTLYLLTGGKTVCIGRGIKYIFQDLPLLNPNHIFMVPGILNRLVKLLKKHPDRKEREKYIGTNLKYIGVGGAASNEQICKYLINQGFELSTGYGLSETAGSAMMGILTEDKVKSIGKLEEGMKCRIENGEILLSGESIMLGYYKDLKATQQAIKDGWLHTGDLGYQDKDGWYYLTGRKKNVIILSNGENVSPEQLEETLSRYEVIIECIVYSVPKGICADIYTQNKYLAERCIREYNLNVPTYRQIFHVNYYNSPLEKTGSGKIKRKVNQYE